LIFDSRGRTTAERLELMNDADGVWRRRTVFNCTGACPRGIQVTKAIIEMRAGGDNHDKRIERPGDESTRASGGNGGRSRPVTDASFTTR
jgi:hypothetical protein